MAKQLTLEDAWKAKNEITDEQLKTVQKIYSDLAKQMADEAEKYKSKKTPSSSLQAAQAKELEKMLNKASAKVAEEINTGAKSAITNASKSVIESNVNWMASLGFPKSALDSTFVHVPENIVQNIASGKIYKSGWSLSKAIWGDKESTMQQAYEIVAKGRGANQSTYEIAKNLEQFVSPQKRKDWNLKFEQVDKVTGEKKKYTLYPKKVDYSAQRLTRTLTQHSYQQSIAAVTKDNPFVQKIRWRSTGSRVCDICKARDGKLYDKDKVPLDHPNGMCILEPVIDDNIEDRLFAWVKGGNDPGIDKYASVLGYKSKAPVFNEFQKKYLTSHGYSYDNMPKTFSEFSHKLTESEKDEILAYMGTDWSNPHPYQVIQEFYEKNLKKVNATSVDVVKQSVSKVIQKQIKTKKIKVPEFTAQQKKYLSKYGYTADNIPSYSDWAASCSFSDFDSLCNLASKKGLSLQDYYTQYIGKVKYKYKETLDVKVPVASGEKIPFDKNLWLDTIQKQTERKMLEKEAEWMKQLSDEAKSGIRLYSGSSFETMNEYLRYKGRGLPEKEAISKSGISEYVLQSVKDAINGLNKVTLDEDYVLRRGASIGDIAGLIPGNYKKNKEFLRSKTVDELNDMLAGSVVIYDSFTSTSSIWDRGFSGELETVFYAPQGTHASSIMSISQFGTGEGETLLNAGTKGKIVKIEKSDGHSGSSIRMYVQILVDN